MSVLLCRCARAKVLPEGTVEAVRQWLGAAGVEVCEVQDLCALAGQREAGLQAFRGEDTTIIACHERAVRWLFAAAGAPLGERASVVNLRTGPLNEILAQLTARVGNESPRPAATPTTENLASMPYTEGWFPVIDFARCVQCMQCLSFCLFDVYAMDADQHVRVERPANCKPNCPACSRVCPEAAIMFPKYAGAPIDGSPVTPENMGRETVKVDVSALLGGDVYQALRKRSRFSKERDPQRAMEERRRQLAMLGMHVVQPPIQPEPQSPEEQGR